MRNHGKTKPPSAVTSAKTALTPWEQTVMLNPSQPHFPPEILDYAIDFLHDDQNTLRQCCLTSKSWVPRTRKHLFAEVVFQSVANLESWKQTFPDNSDSPAFYTHTLLIGCLEAVVIADAGEDGWIRAFSRVTALELHANRTSILSGYPSFSLIPFHGFSPVLKYLSVICGPASNPQVFELICTLPLLENLLLSDDGLYGDSYFNSGASDSPTVVQDSPLLTGCLFLQVYGGIDDPARRLLCLPNGIRFETLVLSWLRERETQWANALIAGCSDTLRNLTVSPCVNLHQLSTHVDLSKATKLRYICFQFAPSVIGWVIRALLSITHNHQDFRDVSLGVVYTHALDRVDINPAQAVGEPVCEQWSELDHLLARFRDSHSIHIKVFYGAPREAREKMEECMRFLLPETTREGTVYQLDWHGDPAT